MLDVWTLLEFQRGCMSVFEKLRTGAPTMKVATTEYNLTKLSVLV